ncbi:PoNe immunity protein domain-containing protein [Saccharospirillum salsuginis]|uniref:PoNi C-terminal domain-containing protein n=1 Tax=Saccharospirillum salsuginis TaxID=418750 RepID=A0A918N794_9GAMM|nr:PoNe immunity protein domain-containing protein [Saccharospirillum salsuginis]GGX42568.1 hypothetical protein GCM10007392_06400 [Saccharospirillum salsuginis]
MVMRQTSFADQNMLDEYRAFIEEVAIPTYENTLSNPDLDERKRKITSFSRFEEQLELTIIKYTLGYGLEEVKVESEKSVAFLKEYLDASSTEMDASINLYMLIVWALSIAYLLKVNISEVGEKIPFLEKDMLVGRLYNAFDRSFTPCTNVLFPALNGPLCDALGQYDDKQRNATLDGFLKGYFQGLEKYGAGWLDSHKELDPEYYTHFGYWVFELGALVVDIDWDDSKISDNPLYPIELVDWRRNN